MTVASAVPGAPEGSPEGPGPGSRYVRLLRLRRLRPQPWQRVVLVEGSIAAAAVLVLADVASLWTLVVLPLVVSVVVKADDAFLGLLASTARCSPAQVGPSVAPTSGVSADGAAAGDGEAGVATAMAAETSGVTPAETGGDLAR